MNNYQVNECIKCAVNQCAHHCKNVDYCSLPSIKIGTHENNPTMDQCTDCQSFDVEKS